MTKKAVYSATVKLIKNQYYEIFSRYYFLDRDTENPYPKLLLDFWYFRKCYNEFSENGLNSIHIFNSKFLKNVP